MNDMERLEECLTCRRLDICRNKDRDNEDENGHCTEYTEDKLWRTQIDKQFKTANAFKMAIDSAIEDVNKISADSYEQGKKEVIEKLKMLDWYSMHNGKLIKGAEGDEALVKWSDIQRLIDRIEGGGEE